MSKSVMVGNVQIGGGAPVVIQSMTNTDTRDREATLKQIIRLYEAGCQIARLAVHDEACVRTVCFASCYRVRDKYASWDFHPRFMTCPSYQKKYLTSRKILFIN